MTTELAHLPPPCPTCGSIARWTDAHGNEHCPTCRPPRRALQFLEHAEAIRKRHHLPSPEGVPDLLAELRWMTEAARVRKSA